MNDKEKAARAQHDREVAQLADFNYGHLEGGAAVRGEAIAEELREIDVVLAENDRLRDALADKISGETLLTELNMNQGGLNMQFEGGACQMLAEQFAQQFRESGATHYIEIGFTARSDGMPLLVTIQRVSGKTPATLKTEAEAKLATAKNFHRSLCDRFGYCHDDQDWLRDLVSLEEFIAAKVSARAADAPSEPMSKDLEWLIQCADEARANPELATTLRNNVKYGIKSRAADALDSRPDGKWMPRKLTPKMAEVLEFGRKQPVHNTYLNLLAATPDALDSQPTDPASESRDSILGKVICILSDEASEWSNEDQPIFDRCIERILGLKRQPTDGGVRK